MSLDVFRGATIAAMIVVNNPGSDAAYAPLKHSVWNGWTPTDLIFPFFLFMVGVSLVMSFASRMRRGESKRALLLHSLRRGMTLFAIGLLLNFGWPLSRWRIPGVLQRIGICYFAAAVLVLYTRRRTWIIAIPVLLIGYWLLMSFVPVPGYGLPGRDVPLLQPDHNLAAWLDRLIIPGRFYEVTRDPEGILSTFPSIATVLLGVLTGDWLRSRWRPQQKAIGMAAAGIVLFAAGELWGVWFPINKKLWTSSFVLLTAGLALIALALCYWISDIRRVRGRWTKPFVIFGSNAIAVYVIAEVLAAVLFLVRVHVGGRAYTLQDFIFQRVFSSVNPQPLAALLYALAFATICFLPIWWMYRKGIFLKV
jgi:predicted acyltransferase